MISFSLSDRCGLFVKSWEEGGEKVVSGSSGSGKGRGESFTGSGPSGAERVDSAAGGEAFTSGRFGS
jgi:hypothetical protein